MKALGRFALAVASFIILDLIWLGFVVKEFNLRELSEIGRIKDGSFEVLYLPSGLVYVLMALAVQIFVLPKVENQKSRVRTFLTGALMGLVVYGVFDFTNLAIIKNYPVMFAVIDITWGCIAFGIVSAITKSWSSAKLE